MPSLLHEGLLLLVRDRPDPRKLFTWPFYAVAARARHECPFAVVVQSSLGEAARKVFEMLPESQPFLIESQRRLRAEGRAEDILKILAKRGVALAEGQRQRILGSKDLAALDRWFDRDLTVTAADELFE